MYTTFLGYVGAAAYFKYSFLSVCNVILYGMLEMITRSIIQGPALFVLYHDKIVLLPSFSVSFIPN
jgi:hypothetical protein